jgi:hypothetical protein
MLILGQINYYLGGITLNLTKYFYDYEVLFLIHGQYVAIERCSDTQPYQIGE